MYDPNQETILSAGVSSFGLGAFSQQLHYKMVDCLHFQRHDTTEQRYGQASLYLVDLQFHIETDQNPLVPLLNTKHLEDLPTC